MLRSCFSRSATPVACLAAYSSTFMMQGARTENTRSCSRSFCAGGTDPSVRAALCQLTVGPDKALNIANARAAIQNAQKRGADFVVLPECWNSPYDTACFPQYAEPIPGGPSSTMLLEAAKQNSVWVVGGSIPEKDESDGKIYNTCVVASPEGTIAAIHRKVHLFDIDVPGKITFKESDTLSAGDKVTVFTTPFGRVGVGICYDMRFPELALLMRDAGADVLVYPGAFNTTTGPAHWHLLQQARAVDNQVFVLTASPARNPDSSYQAWGHSTVIDPWGETIATTGHAEDTVYATIDLNRIPEVRRNVPVSTQKRHDLYSVTSLASSSL
mmetsp:Transcript_60106/g.82345  ORF Transcript_60106/g.82345 Transcript_60106/m.82345 type:complete len:328 (-) Transcript_60106:58-1041(-)